MRMRFPMRTKWIKGDLGCCAWQCFLLWCLARVGVIVVAAICLWLVGREFMTPLPEVDDARRKAADQGIDRMVAELRANAADLHHVELMHFENDPSGYVSETLRGKLMKQGGLSVRKPRMCDKIAKLFGVVNDGCAVRSEVVKTARAGTADAVIWGRVDRLENERGGATFTGDYELYDLKRNRVAYQGRIATSTVPDKKMPLDDAKRTVAADAFLPDGSSGVAVLGLPVHLRFLWFVVVTLLLPVFTIAFVRAMVAKKSNCVNALMLGIYTVVDLVFAFFMIGGRFSGFFSVLLFMAAGTVALIYNVALMSFALRLESE